MKILWTHYPLTLFTGESDAATSEELRHEHSDTHVSDLDRPAASRSTISTRPAPSMGNQYGPIESRNVLTCVIESWRSGP